MSYISRLAGYFWASFTSASDIFAKILLLVAVVLVLFAPSIYFAVKKRRNIAESAKKFWVRLPFRLAVAVFLLCSFVFYSQYGIYRDLERTTSQLQSQLTEAKAEIQTLKSQQFALPEELIGSHIIGQRIRLTYLATDYALIEGKVFDNCEFFGPSVIQFQDPIQQMNTITIVADIGDTIDSIYIATPNDRLTGIIAFKNCIFNNCSFRHVGIIAKPDAIEILRSKAKFVQ